MEAKKKGTQTTINPTVFTGFWPDDQLIRSRGFAIRSRPAGGAVVWVRDGKEYFHRDALETAKRERKVEEAKRRAEQAGGG